jgi:cytidylate kinase
MKTFDQIRYQDLTEGVYDKNIFKAFFLAGGPGSGKSFVTGSAFAGSGLKVINSDNAFERGIKKAGLSLKMPDSEADARDMVRARAKATTSNMLDLALAGRLGLVVDGTGRDFDKISYQVRALKELGYDAHMIFVNTSLDVALQRNQMRSRTIPEYIVTRSWNDVQSNIGKFQNLFGPSNMVIIDNNISDKELTTQTMTKVSKSVNKMLNNPIKSYTAKRWIATELRNKRRK